MNQHARRTGLGRLLFPEEHRSFPGRREVKILLRAVHVLLAGLFTGAVVFRLEEPQTAVWFHAALTSGIALLLIDLHESAAFLCQVRGLVVIVKLALLACLPLFGEGQGWVLAFVVLASVYFSHASSKVRYFLVFGRGKIEGSETSG